MGIEEFATWFWLMFWMKCCLSPAILSSFHEHGRRHYIRAVKMFDRKPSMLCTMIVKSLIHCWDNFEQSVKMLALCWGKILNTLIYQLKTAYRSKITSLGVWKIIKMSSVMPFVFNAVKLRLVTINEKSWTRAREVGKAPEYNKNLQTLSRIIVVKRITPRSIKWAVYPLRLHP